MSSFSLGNKLRIAGSLFAIALSFSIAQGVHAQTSSTPTATQLQSTITTVQGELKKYPADPTTLQQCNGLEKVTPLPGSSTYYCYTKATASGVTATSIPYQAGDEVECAFGDNTAYQYCEVKNGNGINYYYGGNASYDLTETDKSGKVTGGSLGTPNGSATSVAAGCLSGNCAQAVEKAVTSAAPSALSDVGNTILQAIASAILTFANFFLGLAGALFNLVMYYGVFQFGNTIGNAQGVLTAWGILRDLANMALLFGFIFMGIATILDTNAVQRFTARRALPSLVIFAVLMNFSLFTCEALIDVSNALSTSMYSQANTNPCLGGATGTAASDPTQCELNYGLAGHIMESTGLSSIWDVKNTNGLAQNAVFFLGLALFSTIGAIVFIAASIMLALRLIVLTLLMVVSPIGFAGMAVPPLQRLAGEWWNRVIHQAFYAPIMLLLILISLKIADSFTGVHANNGLADALLNPSTSGSVLNIVLVFTLVIGFMIASIVVAHRFGAMGAQGAVNFGKKVVLGSYSKVGRTAAGYAGRNTIGRGTDYLQKKYNSSVASGRLQFLAGGALDESINKTLKKGKTATFGSGRSLESDEHRQHARDAELDKVRSISNVKKYHEEGNDAEFKKAVNKLTDTQMIESHLLEGDKELFRKIARDYSPEKTDKLMNSDKVSEEVKKEFRKARYEDTNKAIENVKAASDAYKADPTDAAKKTAYKDAQRDMATIAGRLSDKDFGQFAQSEYASALGEQEFAGAFTDDQFKDRKKNGSLTKAQVEQFEDARKAILENEDAVADKIDSMNAEAINKLKSSVLSKKKVLDAMSGRKLVEIDPSKIASDTDMKTIVKHIEDQILNDTPSGREFEAQLRNPRNKDRWKGFGL